MIGFNITVNLAPVIAGAVVNLLLGIAKLWLEHRRRKLTGVTNE